MRPLTRVPLVPDFVAGVLNLRGEVLAVLDLARMLGLRQRATEPANRIVVLHRERTAGLLVESLTQVRTVTETDIAALPPGVPSVGQALLGGVVSLSDRPLLVIDAGRLLDHERLRPFARRN